MRAPEPQFREPEVEDKLKELLDPLGEPYELFTCNPELADTAAFSEAYDFPMDEGANCIIVVGKSDPPVYAACLLLAHTKLDVNKTVRKTLGVKRASFADSTLTEQMTGMKVGGVTPIGLPEKMPLLIDSRVGDKEQILVGGGARSCKVMASPKLFLQLPNAQLVQDLAIELPN